MIRRALAVTIALCLGASWLSAQTADPQNAEFTVKAAAAEVHKGPSMGSPVIGTAPRGIPLAITRNLGSWVEVPWPAGEGGVAFLHVNTGSITRSALPDPSPVVATPDPPTPAPAAPVTSEARAEQIAAVDRPTSSRQVYISLPSHVVGVGGRMSGSAPGIGFTARKWWGNRLGLQFEVSRHAHDSLQAAGRVTSLQFVPSLLYLLPHHVTDQLWVRPYLGAGGSVSRSTLTGTTFGLADSVTDNGVGFHALGGTELTLAGAPQFSLSADIGYRWSQASFTGFEPSQIGFSLSGHWYLK